MEKQDKNRDEQDTLLGREVTVRFEADPERTEIVTVRKVALRLLSRFAAVMTADEAAEIAYYTGKSADWAEGLTEESINELLEVGRKLNQKRFENFALRATRFEEQIRRSSPDLAKLAESRIQRLTESPSGAASSS